MNFRAHEIVGYHSEAERYGWAIVEAHRARSAAFDDHLYRPLVRALRKLFTAIAERNRRVETIRELQSLSDHLLRDIGLSRSEIPALAARLVAREPSAAQRGSPVRNATEARVRVLASRDAANDDWGRLTGGPAERQAS